MSRTVYTSDKKIRIVAAVGVFCALAYVACVLFHFRVSFLTFDLKDAVMTVGAMLFGPVYGLAMSVVVALIEMLTVSTTGLYGFIMNVLASASFVCVGSLIYMYRRTMAGAVAGMLASVAAMTGVMLLANLVVTPFYMGVSASQVAGMIPTLLLPFNLIKAVFNACLVFLLYQPISQAVRQAGFDYAMTMGGSGKEGKKSDRRTSLIVTVAAAVLAVLTLLVFFFVLGGTFSSVG